MADLMRRGLKKKTKITQYPWQKACEVEMDKLFVKLTLEKQTKEPHRRKRPRLEHYVELFDINMQDEGERILLKADPGMGKTTLMKKITHDWVLGRFTNVSIVFFVLLKLVKPGETIENVIIKQMPILEGNHVTPEKVKKVLDKFGSRCLLVLDGLDEHALGQNKDVVNIIENRKYPNCKVIVTSRPHSTSDIEEHFDTIGRVEGFTRNEAAKFVKSIVDDHNKVKQILEFSPTEESIAGWDNGSDVSWDSQSDGFFDGDSEETPLYRIPILLSFMGFLVKNDNEVVISLSKSGQKGWIYFRMVRCLYMTYVKKIGKDFMFNDFVRAVRAVGKLAWETLLSGDLMFRKGEFGLEVFAYGLLIGDEDPEGLSDETKDILITFAHRSIQEFFGAFYFILSLSEGETIVSLLGGDCKRPIFLTNPLFLEFCLWLMHSTELTSFPWEAEKVREPLVAYLVGKIDIKYLNLNNICKTFLALDIRNGSDRSQMTLDLIKVVLSRCSKIEHLALGISLPVDELLSAVNQRLWYSQIHTLQLFKSYSFLSDKHQQPKRELLIQLRGLQKPWEMLRVALKYCYRAERCPCISYHYIDMDDNSHLELSELFQINDVRQLHMDCDEEGVGVSSNQDIPSCPSLRQLSVYKLNNGDDLLSALRKAIQRDHLPNLNYLRLDRCSFNTEGILLYLFGSRTPTLEHLRLWGIKLYKTDLQFISELRTLQDLSLSMGPFLQTESVQCLFQNPNANVWAMLSVLSVNYIDSEFVEGFVQVVNENKLPNLKNLWLSYGNEFKETEDSDISLLSLLKLQAEKLPSLKRLSLCGFNYSGEAVQDLAQRLVKWDLVGLCISHGKGISGHLSVLFPQSLPSLTYLRLNSCELTSDDMRCLTETREQGRLPTLERLDVLFNQIKDPELWNENEAWKNVNYHFQEESPFKQYLDFLRLRDSYSHLLGFENSDF